MNRCRVFPGAPMDAVCHECGHQVGVHLFPTGICEDCIEDEFEAMSEQVGRLSFAVQVLSERLDASRINEMGQRLDAFVSSWPRTTLGGHT